MRSFLIASLALAAISASAAPQQHLLRLEMTNKNGTVQFAVKNISKKPIVAYVVVAQSPNHRSVWHGVYADKDALAPGQAAKVGELAASENQVSTFIDYVRLADGTTWGDATTDDASLHYS